MIDLVLAEFEADDWEHEIKLSKGLLVVEFWHEGCVWCKALEPLLADISERSPANTKFARLNILASEANMKLPQHYQMMGTPTVIIFCNGEPMQQIVEFRNKASLEAAFDGATSECCVQ